jgi:hypothetical protein
MELQNDDANNSLWRSSTIITSRSSGSGTHQNKCKSPMTQPSFKRHHPIIFGLNNSSSHVSSRGNGSNGTSNNKGQQGPSKDAKEDFKRHTKSTTFDRGLNGNVVHPARILNPRTKPRDV